MKYHKYFAVAAMFATLFTQNTFAQELQVTQSKNTLSIHNNNIEKTIENIPAYLYQDSNYFMLRDIGKLTGYQVEWNTNTGQISMIKDNHAVNFEELSVPTQAKSVLSDKQNIIVDGKEYPAIEYLNIDGYSYFKLRDLANMMDFSCDWDSATNTIKIESKSEQKVDTIPTEQKIDKAEALKLYLDEDLNQKIIEDDIKYVKGSGDYSAIEAYIKENIDSDFVMADFTVTESDIERAGHSAITMYFKVNDLSLSNFGYRVICVEDTPILVNLIGKKNPDFDKSKIKDFVMSEQEAKQKAIELDGFEYEVEKQTVTKYFDMNDMQCKYEIETVYITEKGAFFATSHTL